MVLLAETPADIREAAERYGRKRSMSSMWFQAIQAKWSSANWAAEPSMQGVWSPICPAGGQPGDLIKRVVP